MAWLARWDLQGLAGEPQVSACSQEQPQFGVDRWIGGTGHELGHAFGLPHPPKCGETDETGCAFGSIMWMGFYDYPNAILTAAEKQQLETSPFFFVIGGPRCLLPRPCAGHREAPARRADPRLRAADPVTL